MMQLLEEENFGEIALAKIDICICNNNFGESQQLPKHLAYNYVQSFT